MSHYLYIIEHNMEKTYCGVTNDLQRRIEEHNGLRKGGAKATRGKEWEYFCVIEGFQDRISLLQFEWRMHHPDGKRKKNSKYFGIEGRLLSIKDVFENWFQKKGFSPFTIYMIPDYIEFLVLPPEWSNYLTLLPLDNLLKKKEESSN